MPFSFELMMMTGLGALAVLIAFPAVLTMARGASEAHRLDDRLERSSEKQVVTKPSKPKGEGRIGQALSSFGKRSAPGDADEVGATRSKLLQAGFPNQNAVSWYYAARFICVVVPQVALLFLLPYLQKMDLPGFAPILISMFLAVGGLALPSMYVDRKIEARRLACSSGFPDMMDLLVACVEAGLSLDASVSRVGEELESRHAVLAENLDKISLELRAGRSRRAAWRSFADRIGLEEAGSLATMLRQSEEMGTSLGHTLRIFSRDMRRRRILIAEEKAMALPAKMTVPLIVFVFPVLLGVLILPAVFRFQTVFAAT